MEFWQVVGEILGQFWAALPGETDAEKESAVMLISLGSASLVFAAGTFALLRAARRKAQQANR